MGNSLRCCLACIIPCGALDLIRIVHLNGHMEEISHPITAGEVLKNNPNHVLSKPSSHGGGRIVIVSPESELKRGSIYFLIPASSIPDKNKMKKKICANKKPSKKNNKVYHVNNATMVGHAPDLQNVRTDSAINNNEMLGKKLPSRRYHRRSGRVGIWMPHLESISEDQ